MQSIQPAESPGFLLWRATLRWQREIVETLRPWHLTHVQFVLLACTYWLNGQGEEPNQMTLATFAATDIKMTSQVLRTLERKGLLERTVDLLDTRARRLKVTARGAELAPKVLAAVQRADAHFFSGVDSTTALDLLRRLAFSD
jgi:DNA-binding MarR family transcriptional regulator